MVALNPTAAEVPISASWRWVTWQDHGTRRASRTICAKLAPALNRAGVPAPTDVVLYGFGRIGRLLARLLIERTGAANSLRLRAIVCAAAGTGIWRSAPACCAATRCTALQRLHRGGCERSAIIANGTFIQVIYANSPADIDYTAYGIDNALIVDNTGVWRDEAGLSEHLQGPWRRPGAADRPRQGEMKNVVFRGQPRGDRPG